MRALTAAPGKAQSARAEDAPDPPASDGPLLVRALGICGTDIGIARQPDDVKVVIDVTREA